MTEHQRRAYAERRMSRAVDRAIVAKSPAERAVACKWVNLWRRRSRQR